MTIDLDEASDVPEGMVKVAGNGEVELALGGLRYLTPIPIGTYFMDRYEVTNEEYLKFVEDGGYKNRDFWKHTFLEDGEEISWDAASCCARLVTRADCRFILCDRGHDFILDAAWKS